MKLQLLSFACLSVFAGAVAPLAAWESVWSVDPAYSNAQITASPTGLALLRATPQEGAAGWFITQDGCNWKPLGQFDSAVTPLPFDGGFIGWTDHTVVMFGLDGAHVETFPAGQRAHLVQLTADAVRYFEDGAESLTIHESSDGRAWNARPSIPTTDLPRKGPFTTESSIDWQYEVAANQIFYHLRTTEDTPTRFMSNEYTATYVWSPEASQWLRLSSYQGPFFTVDRFESLVFPLRTGKLIFQQRYDGSTGSFATAMYLPPVQEGLDILGPSLNTPVFNSGPQLGRISSPLAPLAHSVLHGKALSADTAAWWLTINGQDWLPLAGIGPTADLQTESVAVFPGLLLAAQGGALYRLENPRWAPGWHDASGWSYVADLGWIWLRNAPWCYILKDQTWALAFGDNPADYWLWTQARGWVPIGKY